MSDSSEWGDFQFSMAQWRKGICSLQQVNQFDSPLVHVGDAHLFAQ